MEVKLPSKSSDEFKLQVVNKYKSKINAWASNQSAVLKNPEELLNLIQKYKKKYSDENNVPRPGHWSGWCLKPNEIEFWLQGENRAHHNFLGIKKSFHFPSIKD